MRFALLPLLAASIMLLVGIVLCTDWRPVSRLFKSLYQDITNPNPLFPGPFTRFTGIMLGTDIGEESKKGR